eukprot:2352881-Pyramimonas_sp.AAC.1
MDRGGLVARAGLDLQDIGEISLDDASLTVYEPARLGEGAAEDAADLAKEYLGADLFGALAKAEVKTGG